MRRSSSRGSTSSATRAMPSTPSSIGRDAAVERRPVVLHAGRHADRLALDVHRDLQQVRPASGRRRSSGRARRTRRWSAPTIRRCRRPPAIRRASSASRSRAGSAAPAAPAAAGRRRRRAPTSRCADVRGRCRSSAARRRAVARDSISTCARRLIAAFTRRRAVVKEIQRPDVDGAAGQIDAGRRGRRRVRTGEL